MVSQLALPGAIGGTDILAGGGTDILVCLSSMTMCGLGGQECPRSPAHHRQECLCHQMQRQARMPVPPIAQSTNMNSFDNSSTWAYFSHAVSGLTGSTAGPPKSDL